MVAPGKWLENMTGPLGIQTLVRKQVNYKQNDAAMNSVSVTKHHENSNVTATTTATGMAPTINILGCSKCSGDHTDSTCQKIKN